MRIGMKHREWEGMGWKKSFPLISKYQPSDWLERQSIFALVK